MSLNIVHIKRRADRCDAWLGTALAAGIAAIGWAALTIEFDRSVVASLAKGRSLAEALFLYFRFFTNLTNIGIAALMSVTVACRLTQQQQPVARLFNAGLVYILVTGVTYEFMLRSHWSPAGLQYWTDLAVHDIVPILTLIFWIAFAPRDGTHWRDALLMTAYPAMFFAMTLAAGALGEGYPYNFLNVDNLGLGNVLLVALVFLAIFYVLGLVATALSMSWDESREY